MTTILERPTTAERSRRTTAKTMYAAFERDARCDEPFQTRRLRH